MTGVLVLGAALTLVVFAVTGVLGGATSAGAYALLRDGLERLPPGRRARWLVAFRLFPAALALFVTSSLFLPAFLLLEPTDAAEEVGLPLALAATACLALVLRGPLAAARAYWDTQRRVRGWLAGGEPLALPESPAPTYLVDAEFPLVAVYGVRRPRVLVARSVRDVFTGREIAAVLEHERAHVERGDNLKRLLLRATPDPLAWTPVATRLEQAWSEAIEEAADRATSPSHALPLASALVKVARLAVDTRAHAGGASALYRSGAISRRVHWLLQVETSAEPSEPLRPWSSLVAFAAGVAATALYAAPIGVLQRVHALTEVIVGLLH